MNVYRGGVRQRDRELVRQVTGALKGMEVPVEGVLLVTSTTRMTVARCH